MPIDYYYDEYLYPVDMFNLLIGLNSKDLHEQVSERLGIKYLSDSSRKELKEATGIIFGPHLSIVVSLPVTIEKKTKNVHFVVDTGTPKTYICDEVYKSFKVFIPGSPSSRPYTILLNDVPTLVHLPPINSNFTEVNVLGTEFLKLTGYVIVLDRIDIFL